MKTLYFTTFLLAGIVSLHAQENKTIEKQDDIKAIKDAKAFEMKMMKQKDGTKTEGRSSQLASEQGLEQKKQNTSPQAKAGTNSGKTLPNTASFEEILASIPNRKVARNTTSKSTNAVKGLPSTATLAEIKKTIPKN